MRNYIQPGHSVEFTVPAGGVTSGVGVLVGGLFLVSEVTAAAGEKANGLAEGVVELAKTSALALAEGASVYWDNTNKVVNATAASQKLVGNVVLAVANPSPTVQVRLVQNGATAV